MAGIRERYFVQYENGQIRTVVAQGHQSAKREFIARYHPRRGATVLIWPMCDASRKKRMRIGNKR